MKITHLPSPSTTWTGKQWINSDLEIERKKQAEANNRDHGLKSGKAGRLRRQERMIDMELRSYSYR